MKLISVIGISKSGKTTTVEAIIRELVRRGKSVGSIKSIHFDAFAMDTEGTNTYKHRKAGADVVTALGHNETDVLFPRMLSLHDLIPFYGHDYLVIEGNVPGNFPKIITSHTDDEIKERLSDMVIALAGVNVTGKDEYMDLPCFDTRKDAAKLVDLIEEKTFEYLPDFDADCCSACGYSCREFAARVISGLSSRSDCVLGRGKAKLFIDGNQVPMVPFVENILHNAVHGVVKELQGYREGAGIEVRLNIP